MGSVSMVCHENYTNEYSLTTKKTHRWWEAVDDRGDHACGLAYSEDGVVWQRQAGYPGIPWDTMGI